MLESLLTPQTVSQLGGLLGNLTGKKSPIGSGGDGGGGLLGLEFGFGGKASGGYAVSKSGDIYFSDSSTSGVNISRPQGLITMVIVGAVICFVLYFVFKRFSK
jgi:hypothetical protein